MGGEFHPADSRGFVDMGWLQSHHTFSFGSYYNPARMGFGSLRVINDDVVHPGQGFGMHPHDNMEIITVPISGALRHKDSMGNEDVIRPGEVQVMSAGTGLRHSEFNDSRSESVSLLQIWVLPAKRGVKPVWRQKAFPVSGREGRCQLVVSPDGSEGSLSIHQQAWFSLCHLKTGEYVEYALHGNGQGLYVFVIAGQVDALDARLNERDGMGFVDLEALSLQAGVPSQILLMEIPMGESPK